MLDAHRLMLNIEARRAMKKREQKEEKDIASLNNNDVVKSTNAFIAPMNIRLFVPPILNGLCAGVRSNIVDSFDLKCNNVCRVKFVIHLIEWQMSAATMYSLLPDFKIKYFFILLANGNMKCLELGAYSLIQWFCIALFYWHVFAILSAKR